MVGWLLIGFDCGSHFAVFVVEVVVLVGGS